MQWIKEPQENLQKIYLIHWRWKNVNSGEGGQIFIYSCLQTVKTIDFKRNQLGITQIYEYARPPHYRSAGVSGLTENGTVNNDNMIRYIDHIIWARNSI